MLQTPPAGWKINLYFILYNILHIKKIYILIIFYIPDLANTYLHMKNWGSLLIPLMHMLQKQDNWSLNKYWIAMQKKPQYCKNEKHFKKRYIFTELPFKI